MLNLALNTKSQQNSPKTTGQSSLQRKPSTPNFHQNSHLNMLNADSPFASATRSIYMGNLPLTCSVRDICDLVRGERGLEAVRLLPAKSCAFVDFITRTGAERFISRIKRQRTRPQISGQDVKLGWAKEKVLQPTILKAIENGATRNVYLNFPAFDPVDSLLIKFNDYLKDSRDISEFSDYFTNEEASDANEITNLEYPLVSFLYGIFDEFGPLDMIKVVPSRRIAFIHMAQVADAMRAVAELPTRHEFKGKRLSFGRDRCGERLPDNSEPVGDNTAGAGPSHSVSQNISQGHNYPSQSQSYSSSSMSSFDYSADTLQPSSQSQGQRTVYLGGCNSPDLTIEDICDHIHTGQLQSVRLNKERKCAFVTFIYAEGAELFLARALQFGLSIRNYQLKPAYAKETVNSNNRDSGHSSNSLPVAISNALRKGYTRNLYLGNVDFSVLTESRLRTEMSRFGPLDRIQILKDRGVAFVHFANLLDGGRAFEQVKSDVCYKNCRVGFGKDRCEPSVNSNIANNASFYNPAPVPAPVYTPYGYLPNYPPPPFYFHPMMYDPANLYQANPAIVPSDYPPVPYHVQSTDEFNSNQQHYSITVSDEIVEGEGEAEVVAVVDDNFKENE